MRSGWLGLVLFLETEAQGGGAQAVVRWLLKLSCGPNRGRPAGRSSTEQEREIDVKIQSFLLVAI